MLRQSKTKSSSTCTEKRDIFPVFKENYVAIAVNSSDFYTPYLGTYLQSIKEHASTHTNYDVIVFEQGISLPNQKRLKMFFETSHNFSVRFYNPSHLFDYDRLIVSHHYLCKESYFRLVAPTTMKNYSRVIYTDVDLIYNADPKELYELDMQGAPILSVLEPVWSAWINDNTVVSGKNIRDYSRNVLKLSNPHHYFNTGVMLMDIQLLKSGNFVQKCLERVAAGTHYLYQDQDVLNEVIGEKIGVLPFEWNFEVDVLQSAIPKANKEFNSYCHISLPKIIHYIGSRKPWIMPTRILADTWWELARKTPFYEEILQRLAERFPRQMCKEIKELFLFPKTYVSWRRCQLLQKLTWGAKRRHYKQKALQFKQRVKQVYKWIH